MQPVVPIDVDETTGIWRTDGLPMVYLPRHFLVNNHLAVEAALGREAYRTVLRASTAKSATEWCGAQVRIISIPTPPSATISSACRNAAGATSRSTGQISTSIAAASA
ncbi:DUF5943 domain-containing protein [Mesorhizobium sp. ORM6]